MPRRKPLTQKMKKIVFLTAGSIKRASSRFRVYWWLDLLKSKGYEVEIVNFYLEELPFKLVPKVIQRQILIRTKVYRNFKKALYGATIVVIQDVIPPRSWVKLIIENNLRLIFDFSNPIHLFNPDRNFKFIRRPTHKYLETPRFNYLLNHCDAVIVENDGLKLSINHNNVHTISPINTSFFEPNYKRGEKFKIGWTGSPATLIYISNLFDVIEELGEKHDIKMILVGAGKEVRIKNVEVLLLDWDLHKEPEYISSFDVGLFFLPDSDWGRSRGGGKLYVYMASGVPPIASPLGVGKTIVNHEKNGLHALTKKDFYNNIERLILDEELRLRLAKNARKTAVDNFSNESYMHRFLKILDPDR